MPNRDSLAGIRRRLALLDGLDDPTPSPTRAALQAHLDAVRQKEAELQAIVADPDHPGRVEAAWQLLQMELREDRNKLEVALGLREPFRPLPTVMVEPVILDPDEAHRLLLQALKM